VGLPMRRGVSSLNLATSVAAVLFAWRLSPTRHSPLVTPAADDAS
jgi:tRNA(Leu) C34 or U34 (ribose-2'-O)-methylase TrmL